MSTANQTTADKNTVFDIGSITKSFTTLLLADMANRGTVNLNDSIEKYFPATVKSTNIQWSTHHSRKFSHTYFGIT